MANKNFNVKNGLTTGNITLDASTSTIVAAGNITGGNIFGTFGVFTYINAPGNTGVTLGVSAGTQTVANGDGGTLNFNATNGKDSGTGGYVYINAGSADTSGGAGVGNGRGGDLSFAAGTGWAGGIGGKVTIRSGHSGGYGSNIILDGAGNTTSGAGGAATINGGLALGSNKPGGVITIAGGIGTGTGQPGNIIIQTTDTTTSGSTKQTLANRIVISGNVVNVVTSVAATSTTSGAFRVVGGMGVGGNVYAGAFYGPATGLTSIPGANVTGTVANATIATLANTINVTTQSSGNAYLLLGNALTGNVSETANSLFVANTTTGALYSNTFISSNGFTMSAGNANFDSGVLFVDGTNNRVGVGTTSPAHPLHVVSSGLTAFVVGSSDANNGTFFAQSGNDGAWAGSLNDKPFVLYANAIEKMRITSSGNVGINTTNPAEKLAVNQGNFYAIRTGGAKLRLLDENNEVAVESSPVGGDSDMVLKANGTERVRITGVGNVGIGTTTPGYKLDVTDTSRIAGTIHFFGALRNYSGEMILNQAVDSNMLFYTNAAEKMRITNTGNVGIGTNNPGYKLEVNGAFAATTKSFVIDHPTKPDMKLRYGSLEGPENGVYIRGRNKGDTIKLPDYWTGLVDEFSITVNLTPIGNHQKLYVKSIENNTVIVGGGFFDEMEYFYTVFAERKDVDKLIVEI